MRSLRSHGAILLCAVVVVSACGSSNTTAGASGSGSARPSAAPRPRQPPQGPAPLPRLRPRRAAASVAPAPRPSRTCRRDQLVFPGKLLICSDIPYPPQEFFDDQGNPIGSDIEIGQEIARRLGLQPEIVRTRSSTRSSPALTGGKCDIIISAQNITADRKKQVDMIPYFQAGQSFVVAEGQPAEHQDPARTCAARRSPPRPAPPRSTTSTARVTTRARACRRQCTKAGKAKISVKTFDKDSDALLALQGGQVDAYFADSPVAGVLHRPAPRPVRAVGPDPGRGQGRHQRRDKDQHGSQGGRSSER